MIPALEDSGWIGRYARAAATKKNCDPETLEAAVRQAFETVYRIVAFDVDGTLTEEGEIDVNEEMAGIIGDLLGRSVPVLLITGRGRTSARAAARQIQAANRLSPFVMRRLTAITHNGVFLLQTSPGSPEAFLAEEHLMTPNIDVSRLRDRVAEVLKAADGLDRVTKIHTEPNSVRLTFLDADVRERAFGLISESFEGGDPRLWVTSGFYGYEPSVDISPTNKARALEELSTLRGVTADQILRIGDQGQPGGNDFDLLDSPAGFSVGAMSESPTGCLPVLDKELNATVSAAQATRTVLAQVMLFSPLSVTPKNPMPAIQALARFNREAMVQARRQAARALARLRLRLGDLEAEKRDPQMDLDVLQLADIFDPRSGGVRFFDWEIEALPEAGPAQALFEFPRLDPYRESSPQARWSVYTDTALLARGPLYYFGETQAGDGATIEGFLACADEFVGGALALLRDLEGMPFSLVRFKLIAAVQDNVRNFLLSILWIVYNGRAAPGADRERPRRVYESVRDHAGQQCDLLFGQAPDWQGTSSSYRGFLEERICPLLSDLRQAPPTIPDSGVKPFKTRECDHFLENYIAVEIGLRKLRKVAAVRDADRLLCLGLANGGNEFPAIADALGKRHGFRVTPAIARISLYSEGNDATAVRRGGPEYVEALRKRADDLCLLDDSTTIEPGTKAIVMDDNCTTAATLQTARDLLLILEADVVGAVIARMPGTNRQVQMAMPDHGFPDPEILFAFVRGLISPSPYARLLVEGPEGRKTQYLDETKVFNKAEARYKRYLYKNGTRADDWPPAQGPLGVVP